MHEAPIADLRALLGALAPVRNPGVWAFVALPPGADPRGLAPLAVFREAEGESAVLEEGRARAAGLEVLFRAAWITLAVRSDLHAVGLTAAVAAALAREGIACNVVAAARHDHLFVPVDDGERALAALRALREGGAP